MVGDALEMTAVKRALTGIDAVTQSLGVSAGPEIIFEPTRLFSKATQVLVTAMATGTGQTIDLRNGLRGWRQSRQWWVSL
jgi:hypothetical protein